MQIPKRRDYRPYIIMSGFCIMLGTSLILSGSVFAHSPMLPTLLRGQDNSRSNNSNVSNENNRRTTQNNAESQRNSRESDRGRQATAQAQSQVSSPVAQPAPAKTEVAQNSAPAPAAPVVATYPAPSQPSEPAVQSADTSEQSRQLAAAQADKSLLPQSYESVKISLTERNQFYRASLAVAALGSALYLLSLISIPQRSQYRSRISVNNAVIQ